MDKRKMDRRKIIIDIIRVLGQFGIIHIASGIIPRNLSTYGKICAYISTILIANAAGPIMENEVLRIEEMFYQLGHGNTVIF